MSNVAEMPRLTSVRSEKIRLDKRQNCDIIISLLSKCGSSSVVEHNLAKVGVAGSSPVFRSIWRHSQAVRQRSAKPLFPSSNLGVASNLICRGGGTGRRTGLKIPRIVISVPVRFRSSAPVQKITPVSRGFFLSKIKIKKGIPKAFVEINMQRCN